MSRKYDIQLIGELKRNRKEVLFEDVPVIVKPIPDDDEDGDMDPRLYAQMKKMGILMHLMPKPKKNCSDDEKIRMCRKMFSHSPSISTIGRRTIKTQDVSVTSADGASFKIRIYKRINGSLHVPMILYCHGGAFLAGGLNMSDGVCRSFVKAMDCVVVNVDYRTCPEAHYPQPLDDCEAALAYMVKHADEWGMDVNKIVVAGDSAGGNLACALTLKDRDENQHQIKLQLLLYPALNLSGRNTDTYLGVDETKYHMSRRHAKMIHASIHQLDEMGGEKMLDRIYLQGYLPAYSIYASPLLDDGHDLPPTMLIFGEHDFLAFEDFAYAKTLHEAHKNVRIIVYRGLGHAFINQVQRLPQADDAIGEMAGMIKETFQCTQ